MDFSANIVGVRSIIEAVGVVEIGMVVPCMCVGMGNMMHLHCRIRGAQGDGCAAG